MSLNSLDVVDVLFVGPLVVAGVLQQGPVDRLVLLAVAEVLHPVPHRADDPAAFLVDHPPLGGELGHLAGSSGSAIVVVIHSRIASRPL